MSHFPLPPGDLPVVTVLETLGRALRERGVAVLQAPPGAGKSTLVPLFLAGALPGDGRPGGRILLLEPRRLAARAVAERMARTLGEGPGGRVGYRIRGEARVSLATRTEVVTEGILTRMIQDDPALPGVSCVILDEFHERSLHADLGLALALEVRAVLRPDLALLVMSATLDAAPVAALMGDAPVISAEGRGFPVETRWLARPVDTSLSHEGAVAGLVRQALVEAEGAVLVFLPGEREIRRVAALLAREGGLALRPLYGAMPLAGQQAALALATEGRKVVLATAIAQTSLTIPDIRIVVDGGRVRRARFDPASGMTRLVTGRVTRAEAEQRRGRAGRVAAGLCYRLWTRGEEGALAAFPPPGIVTADLAPLALELALWGSEAVPLLTSPDPARMGEARALLSGLGALDGGGRITAHGRALARLPLHPRLGHMLTVAGPAAAPLAALLDGRDPLRDAGPDLAARLDALRHPPASADRGALARIRQEGARLARSAPRARLPGLSVAQMAALAYPDRIGLRREGDAPRYLLSGGRGAFLAEGAALGRERLLVATDLDGERRETRIRQGITISGGELRAVYPALFHRADEVFWDERECRVVAQTCERFGALVLATRPWPDAPAEARARAALEGLRATGLVWAPAAQRLRDRIALVRGAGWPEVDDAALLASGEEWLLPWLADCRRADDIRALDLVAALRALIGPARLHEVDRLAPEHFTTPLGRRVPIVYEGGEPTAAVRLQEMFGLGHHPVVGAQARPLRLELLSPAGRPLQVTSDLPGFWAGAYAEVRKEMRGRYPRHPWPEDPILATPTLRARPRGG